MSDHIRQQIREKVVTLLTGLPTTGANVHNSRVKQFRESDLPALNVFVRMENSSVATTGRNPLLSRNATLVVKCYTMSADGYETILDTMAKEIEEKLGANQTLDGIVKNITPTQFDSDAADELQLTVGLGILAFNVPYFTAQGAPTVAR